ncbi:pyruvate dehydrogenase [acetyl-transferring]-phosphatase 1, mitochondrial-like [Oppia nitens]|uniref:pyruvate dehydrogenase [acetyl-transferring]-phosphatase 1, mitochondrial-like n=1 Tax=Oppia nitens TaxID=1686743 RepID=UPI0023D9E9A8|nr:pyruvate dehydrogenase [acetyl-transferring]-phosphatase 1, mitochondrial-like [Oppia nitens]
MLLKLNQTLLSLKTVSKVRQLNAIQAIQVYRYSDKKVESYFSAIGGQTDEPPPDLSPQQVNTILRTNETRIEKSVSNVKLIECNQLASNHPIEDRLRISRIHSNSNECRLSDSIVMAVFDGHGGGSCADIISRRLFHYIALALNAKTESIDLNQLNHLVEDLFYCPNPYHNITHKYEDRAAEYLKKHLLESEQRILDKFTKDFKPRDDISSALETAFLRCDSDLSDEIEHNLLCSSSNTLLHYYLSLAVSGCCVTLILIHNNIVYIASTGDCRAVLGLTSGLSTGKPTVKTIDLSKEHNSDNISELKRVFSEHPKSEQNNIIRNERLLGQLMPLRAFGDFSFKWSIDKLKRLGLTRAFGSHIIPSYYMTPPYLTCKPDVEVLQLKEIEEYDKKFIVLATDGLWEHFEANRKVVKCVKKYMKRLDKQKSSDSNNDKISFKENTLLSNICDLLKDRAKPVINSFDTITRDDDLIEDTNCATHLIRTSLGDIPSNDTNLDQYQQQLQRHTRLVTYLTLPQSVVRNFRDDISLIVIDLK